MVVARNADELLYWEDVEEGFNISPIGADGIVLQHWCNQDDLGIAVNSGLKDASMTKMFCPQRPYNLPSSDFQNFSAGQRSLRAELGLMASNVADSCQRKSFRRPSRGRGRLGCLGFRLR